MYILNPDILNWNPRSLHHDLTQIYHMVSKEHKKAPLMGTNASEIYRKSGCWFI